MLPFCRLVLVCVALQAARAPDPRAKAAITLEGTHAIDIPTEPAAWKRRAEELRRQVLVSAGLWPLGERGPVNAVERGEIARDGYTVKKLLLETRPGFFVAANLYVPEPKKARMPAVLSPHGHWSNGRLTRRSDEEVAAELASGAEKDEKAARFHLQARCAQLARMGAVVLFYDMVGYADTHQLEHGAGFSDLESVQWGLSAFGLQTWDSLRALDWLAGLPEVDAQRIGVTGASGGGTQTFILCAIDPRPAVAFPAVMVSARMQGGCVCENAPHLRVDTNNVEITALMAPRPLAMSGANDWTVAIETEGLPELKRLWTALGAAERVTARCWPEYGHNYNLHAREMMYAWMNRYLDLGRPEPVHEEPFEPLEPAELAVVDAEHPLPGGAADAAAIRGEMLAEARARAAALVPRPGSSLVEVAELRRIVGGALAVLVHANGSVKVEARGTGEKELELAPADGRGPIAATYLVPAKPNGTLCVALDGAGRKALLDPTTPAGAALHTALDAGTAFLLPAVLFDGQPDARLPVDESRNGQYVGYTLGYNRTLVAERVRDVFAALAYAHELPEVERIVLWGAGDAGPVALLAAALTRRPLARVLADRAFDFADVAALDDPRLLPGALAYGDLPNFAGLIAPTELRLAGSARPATVTESWYAACGAGPRFSTTAEPSSAALAWLTRAAAR